MGEKLWELKVIEDSPSKKEGELSLKIALGNMDEDDGLLSEEQKMDLDDLRAIQTSNFFSGTDEFIKAHGIESALGRFRASRVGQQYHDLRSYVFSEDGLARVGRIIPEVIHILKETEPQKTA